MPDMRLPYSAGRSDELGTFIQGPDGGVVAIIPAKPFFGLPGERTEEERWELARNIANTMSLRHRDWGE